MELRKDYILDRWIIIATGRGKRPEQFKSDEDIYANDPGPKKCFFCPGNENMTPDEIGRLDDGKGGWKLRWFPNKFAAVDMKGDPTIKTENTFYTYSAAYGDHEILVETNDHKKQLRDLSEEDITEILKVMRDRIEALIKKPGIKYVDIFKNEGLKAGTSIIHSHSQIISLNIIPTEVTAKIKAAKNFGSCPYCKIIESERNSERQVHEDDFTFTFTPYASRFNFEAWIFPKKHYGRLTDFSDEEISGLAAAMKRILVKLKELNVSFNIAYFYAPDNEDLHFHIAFLPRIATWAGFELESGVTINVVSPEDAAKFYMGEHK
jgi:UDPglucose--hexose-1-phosphate uridylyltransferase